MEQNTRQQHQFIGYIATASMSHNHILDVKPIPNPTPVNAAIL